ncbi:MAG: magnesium/cobalt transporter CorA [Desulfobacterales bacterium]|nr:magnesium/cobalt transporter CorA [Desulfobacterales bacterium]MDJ0855705.1 magnesium/cobalt transporter CorA [Desulfobacterales bacterium]MDJ0886865.1 magnesium/cobalt transporter CorA [Desulfobacterales bacterium]MDJ0990085.1 magnesium/cobalt transporter CorA [Desulfobacterales bacterium]
MPRFIKQTSKKAGLPPGALVHIGERKQETTRVTVIDYDGDRLDEATPEDIEAVFPLRDAPATSWINVDGVHDLAVIEKLGQHFLIHPLTLEDTVNTAQRPKLEDFDDYLYIVLKMLTWDASAGRVRAEQVSLVLGHHFLISFQEAEGDVFAPVRARIRQGRGRLRRSGGDYLAYALIDCVVDHYFVVLEHLGEKIEALEAQLYAGGGDDPLAAIFQLKQEMIYLRRQIGPLREPLNHLHKSENPLVQEKHRIFFADVYDHLLQALEVVESLRDVLSGLQDLYISMTGQRMNEIMKVLTIIATIFIPVTFVAGIYGMNFEVMPELKWRWGYFAVWGVFAAISAAMLFYFKRRKWL